MTDILDVRQGNKSVGKLTLFPGDRSFFAFEEAYLNDPEHPVLSQSFITASGDLIPETRPFQTRLPAFFSNLLPEGHLREYLAARGGIKPVREFKLIELLGEDLPGAVIVKPLEGRGMPPETEAPEAMPASGEQPYRFSLAGGAVEILRAGGKHGGTDHPGQWRGR